jgi:hypothetical protein
LALAYLVFNDWFINIVHPSVPSQIQGR